MLLIWIIAVLDSTLLSSSLLFLRGRPCQLTLSTGPTMPSVRALNDPALRQWCEAFRTLWTCLHFAVPPRSMRCHPGFEGVMVIRRIRKIVTRRGKSCAWTWPSRDGGRYPIIQTGADNEDGDQHPQRLHQQMPLAPFDFLPPSSPRSGPPLGGLDRLALHARATGVGSRPASTRVRSRHALTILAHVPSSRPGQSSHRRYSWAVNHAAACPIGTRSGGERKSS